MLLRGIVLLWGKKIVVMIMREILASRLKKHHHSRLVTKNFS